MSTATVLALDAHGGDFGPAVTVAAALDCVAHDPSVEVWIVGREPDVAPHLESAPRECLARVRLIPAGHALGDTSKPRDILRHGPDSSLGMTLDLVAKGHAGACVSAGSTAALMTLGARQLGLLPGIKRPALMSHFPCSGGMTSMLDLGANLNVDARHLLQFAIMGAVACLNGDGLPRIGLLNVGHEDSKGHAVVREAHELLLDSELNYLGFIEGHDIFEGRVDVAVCDGFAGNLILKSSEGLASMLFGELRTALQSDWRAKLGAVLAKPSLAAMLARLDPAKHNGAPLLGLAGVVVKSHGRSGRFATFQALLEARREVERRVPERIAGMIRTEPAEKS